MLGKKQNQLRMASVKDPGFILALVLLLVIAPLLAALFMSGGMPDSMTQNWGAFHHPWSVFVALFFCLSAAGMLGSAMVWLVNCLTHT
jgi:hypothetical protein